MTNPKRRTVGDYAWLVFTGAAMGSADVVPGVSGGTMAFILGIYEELINTIKSVNLQFFRLLIRFRIRDALEQINWKFIVALGAGLGTAFITLAHVISWFLEQHPVPLFSFFFGLILASVLAVSMHVRWRPGMVTALIAGTLLVYFVVGLIPLDMPHDPFTLFYSGALAITAMILPGISGAFILLILGQYEYFINAVRELDVLGLIPLVAGMVVGIMLFARILSWLLKHFHQITITLLVGFMLGSLRRIWPFKEIVETRIDRHGEEIPVLYRNILPDFGSGEFWISLGLCVSGFVLISLLDHLHTRNNPFVRLFFVRRARA